MKPIKTIGDINNAKASKMYIYKFTPTEFEKLIPNDLESLQLYPGD